MATRRRSILGWNIKPDNSGDVTIQPFSALASNGVWDHFVAVFSGISTAEVSTETQNICLGIAA